MEVKRGDVVYLYECAYIGEIGNIQGGKRPLLIVSNNTGNHFSNICIVCPLTAKDKRNDLPTHAQIKRGMALCEQIFTINKDTIYRVVDHICAVEMQRVNNCLKTSLDLG